MKTFKTLDEAGDLQGRVVLLRADLNVPLHDGKVTDATRIERLVPTLEELLDAGARVVILSHLGRPKGKRDETYTLLPVALALAQVLETPVNFVNDCIGEAATKTVGAMLDSDVVLLENVRFHPGEEENDPDFAAQVAALGQVFVNDAFSAAHRAHATTHGLAKLLPSYAGRGMEAELDALEQALGNPVRPVTAIVGGAKVSTKLDLLNNLVAKIDTLVLGGGMANTFLFAQGKDVGKSLCEKEMADTARGILAAAKKNNCRVVLPVDAITAKEFRDNPPVEAKSVDAIAADDLILDIGPESAALIGKVLEESKTLVWNGPAGAFETPPFETGTLSIAERAASLTVQGKLISVAGGGDTVAALALAGVTNQMTYVSTAGGAFLEWMEGKALPGVEALKAA